MEPATMGHLTPGDRLRRLLALCHIRDGTHAGASGKWRRLEGEDLVAALSTDPEVRVDHEVARVIYELTNGRDQVPATLKLAIGRALQVPAAYFEDRMVAEQEDSRRLPGLLDDLGVVGAHLCRCPPGAESRMRLWTDLLEVARRHASTDHSVAGHN